MPESSRRGFLKYAGVGAAAVGAAAVVPTALAGSANAAEPDEKMPAGANGALLAHVPDVHGDEMVVMVEGREVVIHDKKLITRLARHMHAS